MTADLDPTIAAVLDQLRSISHEDWRVTDDYILLRGGEAVLAGTREDALNYMLAYMAGINCARRDFTARCPAMGWA